MKSSMSSSNIVHSGPLLILLQQRHSTYDAKMIPEDGMMMMTLSVLSISSSVEIADDMICQVEKTLCRSVRRM